MKIMGIDISSKSTGYGLIDEQKLLEYGKIQPNHSMTSAQKLCLFSVELKKIIEKHRPDEIAIEDVVQCSSVSVTKILSRFNGIAIMEAYRYLQKDPPLYAPTQWKKCLKNCTGSAKKCETQLAVCIKYELLSSDRIKFYQEKIYFILYPYDLSSKRNHPTLSTT